jgi:hypothetical protein
MLAHIERDRRRRTSLRKLFSRDDPAEYSGARAAILLWCNQTIEARLLQLGVVFVRSGALLIVLRGSRGEIRGEFARLLLNTLQFGSSSKFISDPFHQVSSSNLAPQLFGLVDDLRRPARRKHITHAMHFLETILDFVEQRVIRYSTHSHY